MFTRLRNCSGRSGAPKPNRPARRPRHPRSGRGPLALEQLEDRLAPAVYAVTNTLDDGSTGSFRWAVAQANGNANNATDPGDTIQFDLGTRAQTIRLTGELPLTDPTGPTTIQGPGAGLL